MALENLLGQENRPIVFLLIGGGSGGGPGVPLAIPFGVPFLGIVRPEQISYTRMARGAVTGTVDSAFLDDFGQGVTQIALSGSTGWSETPLSGIVGLKLIEATFVEYLNRRKRIADAGGDPNVVKLLLFDTLNVEVFSVYPHELVLEKTRQRPFLYFYRMRLSALGDMLQEFVYGAVGAASDFLSNAVSAPDGLEALGSELDGGAGTAGGEFFT